MGLNYQLDVLSKEAEMHMGVIERGGLKVEGRE